MALFGWTVRLMKFRLSMSSLVKFTTLQWTGALARKRLKSFVLIANFIRFSKQKEWLVGQ
jgi:hypothetical protein